MAAAPDIFRKFPYFLCILLVLSGLIAFSDADGTHRNYHGEKNTLPRRINEILTNVFVFSMYTLALTHLCVILHNDLPAEKVLETTYHGLIKENETIVELEPQLRVDEGKVCGFHILRNTHKGDIPFQVSPRRAKRIYWILFGN